MKFRARMLDNELRNAVAGLRQGRELPENLSFTQCGQIQFELKPLTLLSDNADNQQALAKVMERVNEASGTPVGVCTFRNVHVLRGLIIDTGNRIVWRGGLLNMSAAFNPNMARIGGENLGKSLWSIDIDAFDVGQSRETGVLVSGPGFGNYGHWLIDFVPRFARVAQAGLDAREIVQQGAPSWGQRMAELVLGQPLPAPLVMKDEALHFETLRVPTSIRSGGLLEAGFALATWKMLGERLAASEPPTGVMPGDRIFVSRRRWTMKKHDRVLQNADAVEAMFAKAGFAVISPETLSLAQQYHVFSRARVIVGEDGSGLHNSIYCQPGTRIGVIGMGRINSLHLVNANILDQRVTFCSAVPAERGRGFLLPAAAAAGLLEELT